MKKTIISFAALSAILATGFMSCSKAEKQIENTTTTAEDITRSETYLAAVFNVTQDVASSDGRLNKTGSTLLPPGATMTFTDSLFNDGDGVEYAIDFGAAPGLLCSDGVTRSGRIDVKQSKRFSEVGCVVEVNIPTANAFQVGTGGTMSTITGMAIVTRLSLNTVKLKIDGGKVETKSEGIISFNSDKVIVHNELGQPGIADDVFKMFGSGDGVNSKGKNYTWNTQDSIVKIESGNCPFPVEGVIALTTEGATYKIDFAPDAKACDKKVVFTLPNGTKIPKSFN